jgi:hypothetical protein
MTQTVEVFRATGFGLIACGVAFTLGGFVGKVIGWKECARLYGLGVFSRKHGAK